MENAETPAVRLALRLIGCLERADGDLLEELLHPDGRFAALTGGPARWTAPVRCGRWWACATRRTG